MAGQAPWKAGGRKPWVEARRVSFSGQTTVAQGRRLGFFVLARNDCAVANRNWWNAHARGGFDRKVSLPAKDWTLCLSSKLDGSGPHFVRAGSDFAACTGIFFYRGKRLELGLESMLEDFEGPGFPWEACRGHYAVVVFKAGRLWLASDELGAYKIYRNLEGTVFSSSFSALRATLQTAVPDVQGIYEYAFNGATFGEKTFLQNIRQQRAGILYSFRESGQPQAWAPVVRAVSATHTSVVDAADDYAERLRALFRIYASSNRGFRTALSGGYDSRLILALLLDAGVDPELYVYGAEGDPDVVVAKEIAQGEGLRLRHVDKDRIQDDRKGSPERAWARFDSWKVDGLFDTGIDDEDRKQRGQGADVLNGSGGECFRNFFYLRDRCYSPKEIVWSFYAQYDPSHVTSRFRPADYTSALVQDMRLALPDEPRDEKLDRAQVEALYPLFRVRYWTGRDVGLNQRFGPLLFPFLEPSVFSGTERLPIGFKEHGRLEALILRKISPRLAQYMSSYGFPFSKEPPLRYRLKMALTLWRPPYLRKFSYRVRARLRPFRPRPQWFIEALEAAHLNPTLPAMSEFFRIGQISDMDVLNRVATVELACRGGPWPLQTDGTWQTDPVDVSRGPA